jgi:hypothetical protein
VPVVFLIAIVAVLVGIFFAATGRGGEMAYEHADHAPLDLGPVTSADVALLRPPTALWGYNMQVTDAALDQIARAMRERDVTIAYLRDRLASVEHGGSQPEYAESRGGYVSQAADSPLAPGLASFADAPEITGPTGRPAAMETHDDPGAGMPETPPPLASSWDWDAAAPEPPHTPATPEAAAAAAAAWTPPAEPAEFAESAEPAESAESAEFAEPAESAEPAEPAESAEFAEPAESAEFAEPAESAESAEFAEPAESAEFAEPAESAEFAEPAEPAEFAESAQPAEPAASVSPPQAQPAGPPQTPLVLKASPAKAAPPSGGDEATEPSEAIQGPGPDEATEPSKAIQGPGPDDATEPSEAIQGPGPDDATEPSEAIQGPGPDDATEPSEIRDPAQPSPTGARDDTRGPQGAFNAHDWWAQQREAARQEDAAGPAGTPGTPETRGKAAGGRDQPDDPLAVAEEQGW